MKNISDLIPGDTIDNNTLISIFKCSPQGGMRKSNKTNTLVVVSDHVKSIYEDKWENNIHYYTGMGMTGNQSFDFMQNKTLFNSNSNGVSVYLFEVFTSRTYTFIGQVILANTPFFEEQPDKNNNIRKVCIFPLKVIDKRNPFVDKTILDKYVEIKSKQAKKQDNKSLYEKAKQSKESPRKIYVKTPQYVRDSNVIEFALCLADGICQLCNKEAPFCSKDGEPYLETHHIVWLAKGGKDTIENTVALCPNCHKKMHILNNKKEIDFLKNKVKKNLLDFENNNRIK